MAFAKKRDTFTCKVMTFGFTNAPPTFQKLMSHILQNFLEVYGDDLCIYSCLSQFKAIFGDKFCRYRL